MSIGFCLLNRCAPSKSSLLNVGGNLLWLGIQFRLDGLHKWFNLGDSLPPPFPQIFLLVDYYVYLFSWSKACFLSFSLQIFLKFPPQLVDCFWLVTLWHPMTIAHYCRPGGRGIILEIFRKEKKYFLNCMCINKWHFPATLLQRLFKWANKILMYF